MNFKRLDEAIQDGRELYPNLQHGKRLMFRWGQWWNDEEPTLTGVCALGFAVLGLGYTPEEGSYSHAENAFGSHLVNEVIQDNDQNDMSLDAIIQKFKDGGYWSGEEDEDGN